MYISFSCHWYALTKTALQRSEVGKSLTYLHDEIWDLFAPLAHQGIQLWEPHVKPCLPLDGVGLVRYCHIMTNLCIKSSLIHSWIRAKCQQVYVQRGVHRPGREVRSTHYRVVNIWHIEVEKQHGKDRIALKRRQ